MHKLRCVLYNRLVKEKKESLNMEPKTITVSLPLTECVSSNISGYAWANDKLYVEYKGGSVYCYQGVSYDVYSQLAKAESKGSFISREIKPKYEFTKMQ